MKKWLNADVVSGLFIIILSLFFLLIAGKMPAGAAQFPKIILYILGVLGFILMVTGIRKILTEKSELNSNDEVEKISLKNPLTAIAIIGCYGILIRILGFYFATVVYIIIFMIFFGERDVKKIIITAILVNVFVYLLFAVQLHVRLPKGLLGTLVRVVK